MKSDFLICQNFLIFLESVLQIYQDVEDERLLHKLIYMQKNDFVFRVKFKKQILIRFNMIN